MRGCTSPVLIVSARPTTNKSQACSQTDADGVGGSASKLAISDECPSGEKDNTAAAGNPEAQGEIPEPADSTAAPAAFEAARVLKAGDTVKLLTGSRAGELGLVTEATAGDCEVDAEQWFARSQLEFQYECGATRAHSCRCCATPAAALVGDRSSHAAVHSPLRSAKISVRRHSNSIYTRKRTQQHSSTRTHTQARRHSAVT